MRSTDINNEDNVCEYWLKECSADRPEMCWEHVSSESRIDKNVMYKNY